MRTILIANRGEIACRVLRTARALGYRTVAVFSDADADAPHVALADRAIRIGPGPARDSYLNVAAIVAAARTADADAVHPGYGFLAENAAFARACEDAGLTFLGPTPAAIELMGDKAAAKRHMLAAGVPCVPGFQEEDADDARLIAAGEELGAPLLVKAAAGGGGRGMRRVLDLAALPTAIVAARAEAASAFGSGALILERLVTGARHVEVQVFADQHGGVIHLGERDCSVQRRHQKIIEEAPSPAVDAALRARMGAAAVTAARSIGYRGAGTVEFLLAEGGAFYFLEMNTRLQVEHPVTELVTGLDLVAWQLRIAEGEHLPLGQDDVALAGHAIEVRLYAEDPAADYLPQTGAVLAWRPPAGDGVRVDDGIREGQQITPFYDPMVAKIIAHGRTREEARRRLARALERAVLLGPTSNQRQLQAILEHAVFIAGAATTDFLAARAEELCPQGQVSDAAWATAALLWTLPENAHPRAGWRSSAGPLESRLELRCGDETRTMTIACEGPATRTIRGIGDGPLTATLLARDGLRARVAIAGVHRDAHALAVGEALHLSLDGDARRFYEVLPRGAAPDEVAASGTIRAPTAGTVISVAVAPGAEVAQGAPLVVVEAMKIQSTLTAPARGRVAVVAVKAGEQVAAGATLVELALEGEDEAT
ncbi:MAG: biotin carboxylase N-terminal domain-containing protein [Nannocystaceae bacterium]